jgi:Ubiquitin family
MIVQLPDVTAIIDKLTYMPVQTTHQLCPLPLKLSIPFEMKVLNLTQPVTPDRSVNITVKVIGGESFSLTANQLDSIDTLKDQFAELAQTVAGLQRLLLKGKAIKTGCLLDYTSEKEVTLHLSKKKEDVNVVAAVLPDTSSAKYTKTEEVLEQKVADEEVMWSKIGKVVGEHVKDVAEARKMLAHFKTYAS